MLFFAQNRAACDRDGQNVTRGDGIYMPGGRDKNANLEL